jgi:pimeloyl-ACP methyl ester carboxylesterase/tetratricopeptide (TPR) repeat protein
MAAQHIRYLQTTDGVRLAWAEAGRGPTLVKAANWLSHLQYEWESPIWRHWIRFFSGHFRFVRYDERGCGMTDWNAPDLSFERQLSDLEAVVDAADCHEPFTLLGMSQGGAQCIRYIARHPERVSRLVLCGAYAQGWARRTDPEKAREYDSIAELMRAGWGRNNPVFRQVFTSRFVPDATDEQLAWFNELCLKTATGANAARLFESRAEVDIVDLLPQIRVPALVLHARGDAAVPLSQGHLLASGLQNAQFVELDSNNHILLEHEPAWARFKEMVLDFTGVRDEAAGEDPAFAMAGQRAEDRMKALGDWPRVKLVLESALARDGADRQAYLAHACGTDQGLRDRVDMLLGAADRAGSFLETPAALLLAESRSRDDLSGRVVGSYRVASRLGAGGMGEVYLAHDQKLDRPVAIKFLSPKLAGDRERLRRFHQEARAASSLNHPHIVVVHDFGELDGHPYIVTEFIEGETLGQRLQRGPVPTPDVLEIGIQMTGALAAAHTRGLVHRDIKPDNVMVRPDGYVKVLDFGLAKLAKQSGAVLTDSHTQTGMVIGTPRYMSPEQARGLDMDARTDVWSLGVVLYEMATGRLPFAGSSSGAAASDSADRNVPSELLRIIRKALETERDLRYQSAAELCADLKHAKRETESLRSDSPVAAVGPHAARPPWLRRRTRAATIAAGAILAGALAFSMWSRSPREGDERVQSTAGSSQGEGQMLAVLPFTVRGNPELAYLGEGIVDLLSTKLDGAGDLRTTDPHALLGAVRRLSAAPGDLARGGEAARSLGASLFVSGDLLEAGGRIHVSAALYTPDGPTPLARASAEGELAKIFELIDDVSAQLLVGRLAGANARINRTAAVTTTSLAALKEYLTAERELRAGRFTSALEAFARAVDLDPDFALAWYRRSVASEWSLRNDLARSSAAKAVGASERLSELDRRLLEARLLWHGGRLTDAERLYRAILSTHPTEIEAWVQLAEVLHHSQYQNGRTMTSARAPWERVLFFEPTNVPALWHLARIAALEERPEEVADLVAQVLEQTPDGDRALEMESLRAFSMRDPALERDVLQRLQSAPDQTVTLAVWNVAHATRNLEGCRAVARTLVAPTRTIEGRAMGHIMLAHLDARQGRPRAAQSQVAEAARLVPALGLEHQAWLATLPFFPASRETQANTRERLLRWDAASTPPMRTNMIYFTAHDQLHRALKTYLLGLFAALDGDPSASAAADTLERWGGAENVRTVAGNLARGIRAEARALRGDRDGAAAVLGGLSFENTSYLEALASPMISAARERYRRGELLIEAGRPSDAIPLLTSFAEAYYDLLFEAPAARQLALLAEGRGDLAEAQRHYRRFLELWSDAEPELQPRVAEAQRRIATLTSR